MNNRIITLSGKGSFKAGQYQDITQFYFAAEASEDRFGNFTANQFIKKFIRRFEHDNGKGKSAKHQVTDIYLIDIVKVLPPNLKPVSFAQQLANKLYHHGFTHVRVHSIEKPLYAHLDKITVQTDVQYHYTTVVMEHKIKHRSIALFNLAEHRNSIEELNRAQHTFLPQETSAKRDKRIQQELMKIQCPHQLAVIRKLEQLLHDVHDSQSSYQLNQLICHLKLAHKEEWLSILDRGKQYMQGSALIGNLDDIVKRFMPKDEPVRLNNNNDNNVPVPPPVDEVLLDYRHRIEILLQTLRDESARLSGKRYNLFARFELETKNRKIAALVDLHSSGSFLSMYEKAFGYLHDKRVMRKVKRSFTADLMRDIASHPPAAVIRAVV